ncbi:MAG: hypothetical protein IMX00_07110 [Limnochordales bacterium]|nr:hypothetical protein [Limnochordales bacterium]
MSTTSPAPGPRARWQRLGEELQLLATCFRLAGDEQEPDAPRRVRSLLETALLLRPLVARFDEESVVDRLERQLQTAREWLAWRRQQINAQAQTPANTNWGEGFSLSRLLPLLVLLPGLSPRPDQGGKSQSRDNGPPVAQLLQSLGSLLRKTLGDGLSGVPALLTALFKAGEERPPAGTSSDPAGTQAQGEQGTLPANLTALLPQAQKLADDPEAVDNLLRRAEEKLGKEGLERLHEMARRLAGEMGLEKAS